MSARKWKCGERRELERLIWNCVQALSYYSLAASQLARSDGAMPADFALVRSEYRAASARLKVLRECLAVHLKYHECANSAAPSEKLAAGPLKNADAPQKPFPAQEVILGSERGRSSRSEGQAA